MKEIRDIVLSKWNLEQTYDYRLDPVIENNKKYIVDEIVGEIEKYWEKHKNIKRPNEFDGVVHIYDHIGIEIEYQLYWSEWNDKWYYNVFVYQKVVSEQPILPDNEEFYELGISIDPGDIKSAIRNKKLESLGL